MPDTKYDRDTNRFDSLGLDLNRPVDSVKPNKYPFLQNVRSYQAGRLEPREGIVSLGTVVAGQSPVHSERRLNDPASNNYTRVIGTGTHLAIGQHLPFTDLDSGYSGDPLALVPYRPDQSPKSFMYVADRLRMRKTDISGNLQTIGLPPPQQAPLLQLSAGSTQRTDISVPQYKIIDTFDSTAGWAAGGTAGGPTLLSAGPGYRTTGTISNILYDTGSAPGWACVNLSSSVGIGQGEDLVFNPGGGTQEGAEVESIHSNQANTTIARIIYDVGTTGYCSIALTTGFEQIAVEDFVTNATKSENFRILAVTQPSGQGTNSQLSIRAYTIATFAVGDTLTTLDSFRIFLNSIHVAGETVRADGMRSAVTTGTGTLSKTVAAGITPPVAPYLDLAVLATGLASHADDYMHISIRLDVPSAVTDLRVILDVDGAVNDFTRNYYYKVFSPADFAGALIPTSDPQGSTINKYQTGQQQVTIKLVSGQIITGYTTVTFGRLADPGVTAPPYVFTSSGTFLGVYQENIAVGGVIQTNVILGTNNQLVGYIIQPSSAGTSQWTELLFRLSDLIRVGTDQTRTLANVARIQVSVTCTANINLDLDSWWIGGGYGPDSGPGSVPYIYRYRARIPSTGVRSNWSPALRGGLTPHRQAISVRMPQYTAPAGTTLTTGDFVIDVQRYGGQVTAWHYVGTCSNAAALNTFTDIFPDSTTIEQDTEGQVNWQPWPTIGLPVSGTTGIVAGTTVNDAGSNFSTSWAPGTEIFINGIAYTIYNVISTSRLEIVESAGAQLSVGWKIDEPILMAQPLPCLWGDDQVEVMFACGDTVNPGRLYFTETGNPDGTTETNYIDITNPSESLMNGVIYNGRGYVFSSERYFELLPLRPGWRAIEIPGGRGLFTRWAITRKNITPFIAILSKDGIYACAGGACESLSDADLYPLLPNEGNPGVSVNGVLAPVIAGNENKIQLEIYDDFLYLDYVGPTQLSITTTCPITDTTPAVVGTPYTFTFTASGGTPPYTWSIIAGSLPTGLTLSSAGVLSGTPTVGGTFNFTVQAVDAMGQIVSTSCSAIITSCPDFTDDFNRATGGPGPDWWVFWPDWDFNVTLQTYLGTFGIAPAFDATQCLSVTLPVQGAGTEANTVPAFMVPRSLGCLVTQTPTVTGIGTAQFARITNYHRSAATSATATSGPAVFLWTGSAGLPAACYLIALDSNSGNIQGVQGWYASGAVQGTFYNVITAGFPIAVADGDTLEIRVVPSVGSNDLEILINSVSAGTATDSNANRPIFGCPGMVCFPFAASGTLAIDQEYKNFAGGLRYW